jgi:hypothetical protein
MAANLPGTNNRWRAGRHANGPVTCMKSLFLCILMTSILMASFYRPTTATARRFMKR